MYGSDLSYHPSIINILRHVNVNGVDNFCFEETNSTIVIEVVKSLSTSKPSAMRIYLLGCLRMVSVFYLVHLAPFLILLSPKIAIHLVGNTAKFLSFLKRILSI